MEYSLKIVVAGTRAFNDYRLLKCELNILIKELLTYSVKKDIEIVSGCAKGADLLGEQYAKEYGFKIKRFPADWNKHGKSAGIIRNKEMADYADVLIAFWDGESRGTKSMIDLAKKNKLGVFVIDYVKNSINA